MDWGFIWNRIGPAGGSTNHAPVCRVAWYEKACRFHAVDDGMDCGCDRRSAGQRTDEAADVRAEAMRVIAACDPADVAVKGVRTMSGGIYFTHFRSGARGPSSSALCFTNEQSQGHDFFFFVTGQQQVEVQVPRLYECLWFRDTKPTQNINFVAEQKRKENINREMHAWRAFEDTSIWSSLAAPKTRNSVPSHCGKKKTKEK